MSHPPAPKPLAEPRSAESRMYEAGYAFACQHLIPALQDNCLHAWKQDLSYAYVAVPCGTKSKLFKYFIDKGFTQGLLQAVHDAFELTPHLLAPRGDEDYPTLRLGVARGWFATRLLRHYLKHYRYTPGQEFDPRTCEPNLARIVKEHVTPR